jgi:serine/threonine protein kinase
MDKYSQYQISDNNRDQNISYLLEGDKIKYVKKIVPFIDLYNNEIDILTKLKGYHFAPQIVDHFIINDDYIIIYEYINGLDLFDYTEKHTPTTHIAYQLITIVHILHKIGIFHRDIKLENFIIDNDNKVYIIDFGLSCYRFGDLSEHIIYDMIPGSMAYVSREYVRLYRKLRAGLKCEKNKINAVILSNDLYSLSVTIYMLFNVDFPYIDDIRFGDYDFMLKMLTLPKYKERFFVSKKVNDPVIMSVINLHKELDYKSRILIWNSLTINFE